MNERLKAARKALHLTQREFGRRLGVQDTAISKLESAERNLTDQMILAVCREFAINETWLRTGDGEIFIESDNANIAALASEFNLDDLDQKILETYVKLPEARRAVFKDFVVKLARHIEADRVEQFHSGIVNEITQADLSEDIEDALFEGIRATKQEIYGVGEGEEDLRRDIRIFKAAQSEDNKESQVVGVPRSTIDKLKAAKNVEEI